MEAKISFPPPIISGAIFLPPSHPPTPPPSKADVPGTAEYKLSPAPAPRAAAAAATTPPSPATLTSCPPQDLLFPPPDFAMLLDRLYWGGISHLGIGIRAPSIASAQEKLASLSSLLLSAGLSAEAASHFLLLHLPSTPPPHSPSPAALLPLLTPSWPLSPEATAVVAPLADGRPWEAAAAEGWTFIPAEKANSSSSSTGDGSSGSGSGSGRDSRRASSVAAASAAPPPTLHACSSSSIVRAIAMSNARKCGSSVVAHVMKWSRERDFVRRRGFPLCPSLPHSSLVFFPLNLDFDLDPQMDGVDLLLHKATDEIESVSFEESSEGQESARNIAVKFSARLTKLQDYCQNHPSVAVLDSFQSVLPLVDRLSTLSLLQRCTSSLSASTSSSPSSSSPSRSPSFPLSSTSPRPSSHLSSPLPCVRPPRFQPVTSAPDSLPSALAAISTPAILKPRVACGVSHSHTMAILLSPSAFDVSEVPRPAVLQEYIDHAAVQFKCYSIGSQFFVAPRKSTPNAAAATQGHPPALVFHSLKSLPTGQFGPVKAAAQEPTPAAAEANEKVLDSKRGAPSKVANCNLEVELSSFNMEIARAASEKLRDILRLQLFGFDIVVDEKTKDHVIIDVNYFPSFKDVPNDKAIPALWLAVNAAIETSRQ